MELRFVLCLSNNLSQSTVESFLITTTIVMDLSLSKTSSQFQVDFQGFIDSAMVTNQSCGIADLEDTLQKIRKLEQQHSSKSYMRRVGLRMEPLIDFLTRYSPAIDMMVQYQVTPTALIWGTLKALLEVSELVS